MTHKRKLDFTTYEHGESSRKLDFTTYEHGESSHTHHTRRISQLISSVNNNALPTHVSPYELPDTTRVHHSRRLSQLIDFVVSNTNSLPEYLDNGDCEYVCEHCGSLFWFAERVVSASTNSSPKYNKCCKAGVVRLPLPLLPPPAIRQLFSDPHFMENIRAYNNMFSMTSFGAQIDNSINDGRGPYVFRVSSQVSHWIGSLCPTDNQIPRFLQLYIYDTANEVSNRLQYFNSDHGKLSEDVVTRLSDTLNSCNEYARLFKNAAKMCDSSSYCEFSVRLYNNVGDRRYEPPAPGTLGGIVHANDSNASKYDSVVHNKDGTPKRISKLHPSYMSLQYPLLFPFAEQGWSPDLRLCSNSDNKVKRLTVNKYYSYQIHDRQSIYSLLLNGSRLFQLYLVDAYTCIEENKLDYINANQNLFRSEYVAGLYDAFARGDNNVEDIGKRILLPTSFTGCPRYMYQHYQDALAICRVYGNPQYFVTFTCNVKWPEITRHLDRLGGIHAENRPDIISRVFQMKVQEFMKFIKSDKPFGDVAADLYTIEFQKRGLPHCHTLIWVTSAYKIQDAIDVDNYISAEIPDPLLYPQLHKVVTEYMIHGPCGLARPDSPCMRGSKCSKLFPKAFQPNTEFDKDGYAHYKRRKSDHGVVKNGIKIDNGYVVPYNKRLCTRFNAHINAEYCGRNMMIKYLFKYISKGADRVRFHISKVEESPTAPSSSTKPELNEIKNFVDGRYICPHEAAWRILDFPIHERNPTVQILAVHLEDMQNATFRKNSTLEAIIRNPSFGKTTLTEWLRNNNNNPNGLHLTYLEYPSKYRWDKSTRIWIPRSQLNSSAIGRLTYVHPASGELFYLRMLLCHQRGCKYYEDIRTVNNVKYPSYQAACQALGLIGDDKEWLTAFVEASCWATPSQLRSLFTHMLLFCDVIQPTFFFENQWKNMSDDIRLRLNSELASENHFVNVKDLQQYVLLELETLLTSATPSKSLTDFRLTLPSTTIRATLSNQLLMEETCYDRQALVAQHCQQHSLLNTDQLRVYNMVVSSHQINSQLLLFVYGHGGTGKTFLWTTILSFFRSTGKIVLAVAASGIASLLLPSGRTAHSRFLLN